MCVKFHRKMSIFERIKAFHFIRFWPWNKLVRILMMSYETTPGVRRLNIYFSYSYKSHRISHIKTKENIIFSLFYFRLKLLWEHCFPTGKLGEDKCFKDLQSSNMNIVALIKNIRWLHPSCLQLDSVFLYSIFLSLWAQSQ